MKKYLILLSLIFFGAIGVIPTAVAQSDPTITRNEAIVDFPNTVSFEIDYSASDAPIVEATLSYAVEQFGCLDAAASVPVEVTGDSLAWEWVMIRSGNPPPGANMWWEWTLTDANGDEFTTSRQSLTFTDERFEWQTVEAEGIQLHWYRGDEVGPMLLDAAVAGLDQLENEMGIALQDDVQFYIYGDSSDMRDAVLYIQDWAGGVAFSEYGVILMGVQPSSAEGWGRSTVRHELAHLVTEQFGQSCVGGRRPTWLEEGLAVYAEGELDDSFASSIEDGIENNSFAPLRSLNGMFPAHSDAANAAYAQSYSVVNFLFAQYGKENMQALLLALAEGKGYDAALEQVYGFNVDGLELVWREAIGVPSREIPATPTPILAANVATAVPNGRPQSQPTPPSAAEPPPTLAPDAQPEPSSGICGLGLIPLFLITFAVKRKD